MLMAGGAQTFGDHLLGAHDLLGARWQTDTGLSVLVVTDDGAVCARSASKLASVTSSLLQVGDDGTLRHAGQRHNVANRKLCLLSEVHELTSVHALSSYHQFLVHLVPVWVAEVDASHRGTAGRVMDDLLDKTLDVAMALGEVEHTELGWALAKLSVGAENAAGALALT